ncbi:AAA family ATPase [Gracilinema caldarium]|uniref:Replication-associated recombination protein A n=1 Tax=Gracilinema caldarium (strain ATCC 51460 / DSM 7334 / H1) TaxID=744872 RepID=F8EZ45_GRAC1|nr:AAA family ATPase [Gracilinema caldarium]AEJ19276.1 AAA ATPase central domain protein [Gracilinema caldarium DSM 7334]
MDDLFTAEGSGPPSGPLADRMRPRTLDEVIGQDHIVGPGRLLRRSIQADRLSSIIFYGPPGTGKTSLARVIANTTKSSFESLNAVLAGVKDIREAIDRADDRRRLYGQRTILFVDEVHRWNKAQQDALLPWVENGTVILIGATTENPFFEVNRALVSRSRIFQLKSLTRDALFETAQRALSDRERGYGRWQVRFAEGALEHLVEVASGDARSLLNALELAVETTPPHWPPAEGTEIFISLEAAEESIQRRAVLYDKDGDYHFDTISAFIKSVRGSDPDATLYWLAKMVRAGEDPAFIFRRMIILASEDVGLADPNAINVVISCAEAFDRIGFPEGNFPLAQAALYLATAPKSNSTLAFFDALAEVEKEDAEVPKHLKDGNRDKEGFGHGEGYVYPHAYREHWAAQQYLPAALRGKTFYSPSEVGYEGRIRDEVLRKRELQAAVILQDLERGTAEAEGLSWSAASRGREGWFKRLESSRSRTLLEDRDLLFAGLSVQRHDRILVCNADEGIILWEALRQAPEGLSAGIVQSEQSRQTLLHFAKQTMPNLSEEELPRLLVLPGQDVPEAETAEQIFDTSTFEYILARDLFRRPWGNKTIQERLEAFAQRARALLVQGGQLALIANPPKRGQRLANLLEQEANRLEATGYGLEGWLLQRFKEAEAAFWDHYIHAWEEEQLEKLLQEAGFSLESRRISRTEERLISETDLRSWFDPEKSSWGKHMAAELGTEAFENMRNLMQNLVKLGPLSWKWEAILIHATKV